MKKYLLFAWLSAQEIVEYRVNFFWRVAGTIVSTLVLYVFWVAVLGTGFGTHYYNTQTIGLYYLFIILVQTLTNPEIYRVANRIYSGDLTIDILKPYSFTAKVIVESIPEKLLQAFIIILIFLLLQTIGVKHSLTWEQAELALVALFLAWVGKLFIGLLLSSLAFWFNRIHGFESLIWNIGGLLSGEIIPIVFLPKILLDTSVFLPFRYWLYFPAQLLLGKVTKPEVVNGFIWQIVWIIIFLILSSVMWKKGLKSFEGVGR